jgi:Co/Zn/Cd efflux system component
MDAAHNFSDELALGCLVLAYWLRAKLSRNLQRSANVLNSLGLIVVSGLVGWFAVDRLLHPQPVIGWLPVGIGLLAAAGNWGVARCLRPWAGHSPAIRLAYLHNLGDAYLPSHPPAPGF